MAGWVEENCTIKNCIAANDSIIATTAGAAINRIGVDDGSNIFQNNYALNTIIIKDGNGNVTITSNLNTEAGMSKPKTDLQSRAFYTTAGNWNTAAWDMTDVWNICDGEGFPWLRWQNIDCNTSELVSITASDGIQIYPNPVKDELRIKNGEWRIENVEILDLSGRAVETRLIASLHKDNATINVSSLPQGIYFVKITTDKGMVTRKFIKE